MSPASMRRALAALLAAATASPASAAVVERRSASSFSSDMQANPIRRVVDLLTKMQKRVMAEGDKEEDLYRKYQCYCKTGEADLTRSISAAETKVPQVQSDIEAAEALEVRLKSELEQHKADRTDAKAAVAQATALREKEAKAFAKESSDMKTNVDALKAAVAAIDKGMSGSFLQTKNARVLRKLTIDMDMSNVDRDVISSFLTQRQSDGYAPASGQVIGILKEMHDTMAKDLADLTEAEETSIKNFEALMAAKEKEIQANTKAIESKTERVGQVGVEIVNLKEDLSDTQEALIEDKKFLADLGSNCESKQAEWEERSKIRQDELVALAETIKILNDDDALELFKKTLPGPSFLSTSVNGKQVQKKVADFLQGVKDPRMDMILLTLRGGSKSFDKVIKMIDDMLVLLAKEQTADDEKKSYCEVELDKTEDDLKTLENSAVDLQKAMDDAEATITTLTDELAALAEGIKVLDKQVAEASETRKEENALYKETMAADKAAKELLMMAKNRLAKFYTPKMYNPPAKEELSSQERIAQNMGAFVEQPPALVQVRAHQADDIADAPPPPPETWGAYAKKDQEHGGVIAMMDLLITDLEKEMTEMETEEKSAQKKYEESMADSAQKRATDTKSLAQKEGEKAELEVEGQKMEGELKATHKAAMIKGRSLKDLHLECDWLVANFEVRKEARAGEVDSLKNAKSVLSGADYAMLQTAAANALPQPRLLRGQ